MLLPHDKTTPGSPSGRAPPGEGGIPESDDDPEDAEEDAAPGTPSPRRWTPPSSS